MHAAQGTEVRGFFEALKVRMNRRRVRRWIRNSPKVCPEGFLFSGHRVFFSDEWELLERRLLNAIFPRTDLFLNFGAHHGIYCCLALKHGVKCIAFEPVPDNCAVLAKNVLANGWESSFSLFPVAVADRTGLAEIHGFHRSAASLLREFSSHPSGVSQIVPVHRIDDLLPADLVQGKRVVVLMDIEGSEPAALECARTLLDARPKPIWLIEVLGSSSEAESGHAARIFDIMHGAGYFSFSLADATGVSGASGALERLGLKLAI